MITTEPSAKRRRRLVYIAAAVVAAASATTVLKTSQTSYAQEKVDPRRDSILAPAKPNHPRRVVETVYESVEQDGETRFIPRQHVRYITPANPTPPNDPGVHRTVNVHRWVQQRHLPHGEKIAGILRQLVDDTRRVAPDDQEDRPDRDELRDQLKELLGEQFDAMSRDQSAQIQQLTERLAKLKAQHELRQESRAKIIDRRISDLLREPDPLAWDPSGSTVAPMPPRPTMARALSSASGLPNRPHPSQFDPHHTAETIRREIRIESPNIKLQKEFDEDRNEFIEEVELHVHSSDKISRDLIGDVYSAIGRHSIEESEETIEEIKRAVNAARQAMNQVAKMKNGKIKPEFAREIEKLERALRSVMPSEQDQEREQDIDHEEERRIETDIEADIDTEIEIERSR